VRRQLLQALYQQHRLLARLQLLELALRLPQLLLVLRPQPSVLAPSAVLLLLLLLLVLLLLLLVVVAAAVQGILRMHTPQHKQPRSVASQIQI
jgi:hypothetical protein